jgi:HD-GYP domain-containing protein (c-di-GMP phosphodiesterase class II)
LPLRILALDDAAVGERLGHTIFGPGGQLLLHAGVRLTREYVQVLLARGYRSVAVHDPLAAGAVPVQALRDETRAKANAAIDRALEGIGEPRRGDMAAVRRVVDDIIADIGANASLAYSLSALRSVQDSLFTHSVNVCAYSIILAAMLALQREDLRHLGIGAMLHDVGKIYYLDLVNKPGRLDPDEYERIKQHTTDGFRMLRAQAGIHLLAAHMAYQHHERLDGKGYPRGLAAERIHAWARVAAVADVYDTITGDRPYGAALPPVAAMAELRQAAALGQLDPMLVRHLSQRVAAYPEGTILLLESGEVAVVVGQTAKGADRPRLWVLTDSRLRLATPQERVLAGGEPGTTVRSVLADYPRKVREQFGLQSPT